MHVSPTNTFIHLNDLTILQNVCLSSVHTSSTLNPYCSEPSTKPWSMQCKVLVLCIKDTQGSNTNRGVNEVNHFEDTTRFVVCPLSEVDAVLIVEAFNEESFHDTCAEEVECGEVVFPNWGNDLREPGVPNCSKQLQSLHKETVSSFFVRGG